MSIQLLAMSGTIGSTVSTVTNYNLPFAIIIVPCQLAASLSLSLSINFIFVANRVADELYRLHSAVATAYINISSCLYWFIVRN